MKLEEAREKVLDLWFLERNKVQTENYAVFFRAVREFYDKLVSNDPDILSFATLGDKWQMVNRWIHEYEGHLSP